MGLIMLLPGCFVPSRYLIRKNIVIIPQQQAKLIVSIEPTKPTITVWIHGSRLFPPTLFRRYFLSKPGLMPAYELEEDYKIHIVAETLSQADAQRFPIDHLYIYGWSGKLCFKERERTARDLYESLKKVLATYEATHGIRPNVRIIAHSHGGNVILNLPLVKDPDDDDLIIHELILLACPVQAKTKHFTQDPMFREIYVLYSALDLIQILDPQGIYRNESRSSFFSKRRFIHQKNLAQMKVKLNQRAIMHTEFSHPPFLKLLPIILDEIKLWQKQIVYRADPNKTSRLLCVYTGKHATRRKQHVIAA